MRGVPPADGGCPEDWRPQPPASTFNATHVADVETRRRTRKHDWQVQDFIDAGGICSFSGASTGKTFTVTELAFCVARGERFFGRDVQQGLVTYQVGEGELGFKKRLDGYARDRGIPDLREVLPAQEGEPIRRRQGHRGIDRRSLAAGATRDFYIIETPVQKARVEIGKLKVGAKAKAEKQGGGGTATIEAKHRGGGSYSVIGLRTELVEKLDKEGAEKFNALDDGGKAAFVEANKTAE